MVMAVARFTGLPSRITSLACAAFGHDLWRDHFQREHDPGWNDNKIIQIAQPERAAE
jgi:hypothetical protein